MVRCGRCFYSIYAAFLAAYTPQYATCQERSPDLEIGVTNSDEFADAVLTIHTPKWNPGIGPQDHAKIKSILSTTKTLLDTSKFLVKNERTLQEGQAMMDGANAMFRDLKQWMRGKHAREQAALEGKNSDDMRTLLRQRYSEHDTHKAEEDEQRAHDVVRAMFETMTTFPECVGQIFQDCLNIINGELASLGLSTIEVVVHEKRNADQDGYNKVVIITNELGDRVTGKAGDGIVIYPFLWHGTDTGSRTLGVDGKWNCHDLAPEVCCNTIKTSVPGTDLQGNSIECHLFVPFGGINNPRRKDRVFINLSPDGRVHEPPVIQ